MIWIRNKRTGLLWEVSDAIGQDLLTGQPDEYEPVSSGWTISSHAPIPKEERAAQPVKPEPKPKGRR